MKNILKVLTCTTLTFLLGISCPKAATIAIGNGSISAGDLNKQVSVSLKDDDLKDYTKVEFELSIDTKEAEISFSYLAPMTYKIENSKYIIENASGLYATTIGSISIRATDSLNASFKIVPTNVKFYKSDNTSYTVGDAGIKVDEGQIKYEAPKSNDATLSSLTVSQGTLSPNFSSNTTEYSVTVPDTINVIKISATPAAGATRTGTGNKTLNMGANKFEIVVTAEDGTTTKTYTVNVNRGEITEPSSYLKDLIINNIGCVLSPEFDKNNNKYTVEATTDITSLDLKYELEEESASVKIEGNENFVLGENTVTITVEASDKSSKQVYEIVVNVEEIESQTKEEIKEEKKEEKKSNPWIIVIIVVVILLITLGVAILLFKKKKGKGGNNKGGKTTIDNNTQVEPKEKEEYKGGITEILEEEFTDEKTTTYDKSLFTNELSKEEELEKTKEYNFKNF